ncbi:hypothetical protein NLI96_g4064 [Meripilus lineatus]|uniref:Uncharacterized protein n=1 Tax=Meripilus lineatus TaxID=2056292 RepID=A0AAD5V5B0_9APHY|nr:hypothetical protein NLI96_g4064 [Physisporinus lineatus]
MGMPLQPPASLALFYARAKETFLTPNGPYELLVSSDVLAIFHLTEGKPLAPPPDPAIFNELAGIVEQNLKDSLDRFVVATFNNVGTPRAHCGSVGGLSIGIAWSAPPLIASFTLGGARWWRLIALPGMWLGLTIFISAMYGVCMMIYVFGDLRQLRSFELSRPAISPPKPQEPAHVHNSPVRNVHRVAGNGQRERVGSISREMISGPFRIPQAITRPPKALVVSTRPSVGTIDSHQSGAASQRSRGRVSQRSRVRSRSPSVDSESDASAASVSIADSASSIAYSEEESDDEGYADSDTSSVVRSKRKSRRAGSRRGSEATTTTTTRGGRRASRRPRIFISDAFYDEHPSPEGPATAGFTMDGSGMVWSGVPTPGRHLVNANAMRARGVAVTSNPNGGGMAGPGGAVPGSAGGPPLWPDYAQNEEEEMNATATFIGRYVYEDNDFRFGNANCSWSMRSGSLEASGHSHSYSYSTSHGNSNRRPSGGGVSGSERASGDDLERGMGIGKSLTRMAVERQPVGVFDFDALPPPPMRRRTPTVSSGRSGDSGVQEEAPVPAMPSHIPTVPSHISTVPSHIATVPQAAPVSPIGTGKVHFGAGMDEEKGVMKEERVGVKRKIGWRERVLVYIQTKCGPGNVVSFHMRNVEKAQQQGQLVDENGDQQLRSPISPLDEKTLGSGSNWGSPYSTLRKTPNLSAYPSHLAYSPSSPSIPSQPANSNPNSNPNQKTSHSYSYSYGRPRSNSTTSSTWRDGFKKVSRVPAFASPLTPILNPVIGRAQWEIVVRSALMSLVCCLVVVGGLLAVPEKA